MEVQVYRRRPEDRKRWEYLGRLHLEYENELEFLKAKEAHGLHNLSPHYETQQRWGGGEYQFRFLWRDEEGRKERKGTSNCGIGGDPLPK